MKKIYILFLVIPGIINSQDRQSDLYVFSSGGGEKNNISFTIGEVCINTSNANSSYINEGFQQSFVDELNTVINQKKFGLEVFIYPNPVQDDLKIEITNSEKLTIKLYIYNIIGEQLTVPQKITHEDNKLVFEINFSHSKYGTYQCVLRDESTNEILGSYSVLKLRN